MMLVPRLPPLPPARRLPAVRSEGPAPRLLGVQVVTEAMNIFAYQVSGWEQAQKHESERWAAPYTW